MWYVLIAQLLWTLWSLINRIFSMTVFCVAWDYVFVLWKQTFLNLSIVRVLIIVIYIPKLNCKNVIGLYIIKIFIWFEPNMYMYALYMLMCMCICMYMCMCGCLYLYACVYVCMYVWISLRLCVCMNV
jgi:hypothetical protein